MKLFNQVAVIIIGILLFTNCTTQSNKLDEVQRLKKVESILEIQNVIAAYAMAWDYEKTQEFADHFQQDAVIIDSWHKKEISRYNGVQEFIDARGSENGNIGGHTLSLVQFEELTETNAKTNVVFNYFWYGDFATSNAKVNIRGLYIDEWIKTQDGWRIVKRIIEHENVPEHRAKQFGLIE
jgi:hypothetical protein